MGQRGPAPTPTKLRILRGNPGRRPLNQNEPQPAPGRPKRPAWLPREARRQWNELVPVLERMGVLTEADGPTLAMLSTSLALVVAAVEAMLTNGATVETGTGSMRRQPETTVLLEAMAMARSLARDFGMSPASRSLVKVAERVTDDPFEAFLRDESG